MIEPRPEVVDTPIVAHGGAESAGVLDFSANLNPFGPAPQVVEAVRTTRWDSYPDPESSDLRRLVADQHGVRVERVLIGNGCSELIDLACRAFVRSGDRVGVYGPTYGEYERAARLSGATVERHADLHAVSGRLVFLANPNNPTGRVFPPGHGLRCVGAAVGLLVVDESYAECVPSFESLIGHASDGVLVLRSLTKAHGLAGLRVGYAVGPAEIIEAMRRVRPPWSVNAVAQAAAAAALRSEAYTRSTVARWIELRDELVTRLRGLGLSPLVAATPFFLLPDPVGRPWATRLRRHGVAVRDCASFGLPGVARISPRLAADNARLVEAVRAELGHP